MVTPVKEETESESENRLTCWQSLAYGVGHFNNDLSTSFAFAYYILFTLDVLQFKPWMVGVMMMTSQLSDAFSTVFVSLYSDKGPISSCLAWMGKRKSWHFIGTIGVCFLSPLVFSQCYLCFGNNSQMLYIIYFGSVVGINQVFWSFTQVSHLALIPELSTTQSQRTTLTSLRCASSLLSAIISFCFFIIFLSGGSSISDQKFSPNDLSRFRSCAWTLSAVGCFVTLFFYFGVKEPQTNFNMNHKEGTKESAENQMKPRDWLKEKQFYQIGAIYLFSRHYIILSQGYFPAYLYHTQGFTKLYLAVFPMNVYLVGFLTSTLISLPFVNDHLSRKFTFLIGMMTSSAACCCLWFNNLGDWMYPVSILIGISHSTLLVTALGAVADLVNDDTETSAFVYGTMNFADRFSNAFMFQIIQLCLPASRTPDDESIFYRNVIVFVSGACLVGAFIVALTLIGQNIGNRSAKKNYESFS